MVNKFNKAIRLLVVLLLIYPIPIAFADETTVTEDFDNQQVNEDITFVYGGSDTAVTAETDCDASMVAGGIHIEDMDCHASQYFGSDRYQLGIRSSTDTLTIAFPNSDNKPITEVGFLTLAVDDANTGTIYYDDSTSATFNIVANSQSNSQVTLTAPTGTTINEIVIAGASDNLQDWWLIDNIYYKYTAPTPTTTTTSSTTTTTTTSTTTTTTTTTIPPAPEPGPEPPPTTTTTIPIVIVEIDGEELEYTQTEVDDGTVSRDMERSSNLEEYGCELTDAQIIRGDCDENLIDEDEIIYEEDEDYLLEEEEIYDDEQGVLDDSIIIFEISDDDEFEELEAIELTEEEILEIEKEMEIAVKELELLEESEEMLEELGLLLTEEEYEKLTEEEIFELEKELEEYVEVILEVEEYIEELEEFEIVIIEVEEDIDLIDIFIANDLFPPDPKDVLEDLESVQDELIEEESISKEEIEIIEEIVEEEDEEVFEIFDIFTEQDDEEVLTEEMVEEEVAELEEVIEEIIVIDIPEVTEEELEEFTEEELVEYEEAKEEAIEEFVEELETEEVVEILEEINDVGVENLAEVSEEVIEVVAQVVEEVITIAQEEKLTEEQIEVVAEVLGFEEEEDVEIIAELAKEDETVAQAVEEFVERAVENADKSSQPYTLADATTEIAFESFVASPISVIIDVDLGAIDLKNISNDMTQDQKDKAQEVIVPTILVRIVSFALRRFD